MEGKVTLNEKEQKRVMVIGEVAGGRVRGKEGAEILGISLRQLRRLMASYRKGGVAGLVHGNRGRKPVNAIGEGTRQQVVALAGSRYAGFNQQHYTELLWEREGIKLSRSTVRKILLEAGMPTPRKRRAAKHRSRRERYPQEGMLVQIDGSPHDWLQGRGPRMSLIGAIDDATGKVLYALFREEEDSQGYFILMREIVSSYGIPMAVYHDRHSIFEVSAEAKERQSIAEQLAGKPMLTQFGRLMAELGITTISALSPQAKGRIERLWETFQDRLTSELRLEGVNTIEEANRFLPGFISRHNARFAVPPQQPGTVYRSPRSLDTETCFCFKYDRQVGPDNVVRFSGKRLQILPSPDRLSYARCSVQVHQQLDGALKVYYQGRYLETHPAPPEATTMRQMAKADQPTSSSPPRTITTPAPDHPWRRWVYRPNRE